MIIKLTDNGELRPIEVMIKINEIIDVVNKLNEGTK